MFRRPFAAALIAVAGVGCVAPPPIDGTAPLAPERSPQENLPAPDFGAAATQGTLEPLKRSIAPGRILIIGSSDFITDSAVRDESQQNLLLLESAACYLAAGELATVALRKRGSTRITQEALSPATKRLLGSLDDDVRLTAYVSRRLPESAAETRGDLLALLSALSAGAKDRHLKVRVVDPDLDASAKEEAAGDGIEATNLESSDHGGLEVGRAYLAVVIEHGNRIEKLQFVTSSETLEYDLVCRIAKVTCREPARIAWQTVDPASTRKAAGEPHSPASDLHLVDEDLKEEYETTIVDLRSRVPDDVKVVILCNVEGMTGTQEFWADQFLMRGGGLIVLAGGSTAEGVASGPGGMPNALHRRRNDELPDDFFSHYGFTIHKDVVLDRSCVMISWQGRGVPYPAFIAATVDNIDQNHPVSANFRNLTFMWASSLTLAPKPGVQATELVHSSERAKHLEDVMPLEPDTLLPRKKSDVESWLTDFHSRYLLAGLLEGEFDSYFATRPLPKEVREAGTGATDH